MHNFYEKLLSWNSEFRCNQISANGLPELRFRAICTNFVPYVPALACPGGPQRYFSKILRECAKMVKCGCSHSKLKWNSLSLLQFSKSRGQGLLHLPRPRSWYQGVSTQRLGTYSTNSGMLLAAAICALQVWTTRTGANSSEYSVAWAFWRFFAIGASNEHLNNSVTHAHLLFSFPKWAILSENICVTSFFICH